MSSKTFKGITALAVTTSILAFTAPAFAQLDEIVVTAQKREQNLQDVAISINAFDLEALESKRIQSLEDIAQFSPGVYTTPNPADETGVRVNIRGIGTFDPQIGQDSRTAIYVDGVYYGRTQGLAFDSPDLGRVEILKGPQGTLYGRNAVSGAVNLISVAPDTERTSGAIDAEIGNFDHRRIKGHVNIPLTDSAALRVSGLFSDTDGWVENTGLGEDFAATERLGGRAALRVNANPRTTLDLAADFTRTRSTPFFEQALPGTNSPGAFLSAALTPSPDLSRQDSVNSFADIEEGETEVFGISGIANYSVNDSDDVKLTLAYREADSRRFVALAPTANPAILGAITGQPAIPGVSAGTGFNAAISALPAAFAFSGTGATLRPDFGSEFLGPLGTPPDIGLFVSAPGGAATLADHEQFSAELTYTGSWGDKFDYTGGLFYYDEQTGNDDGEQANTQDINSFLFVLAQFNPLVLAPNVNAFLDTVDAAPGVPGFQAFPAAARGPIPAAGILLGQIFAGNPGAAPLLAQVVGDNTSCAQTGMTPMPTNNFCIPTISSFLSSARQSAANTLTIDTQAFAVYGELTWHINDALRITGGLRYSDDNKDGVGQTNSPFFLDNIDLTGNIIPQNIGEADTESLDPSIVLEWDATEDILAYASYRESFRSGGFNAAAVGLIEPGETSGSDFVFDKETISAYEVGVKSDLWNNRFRLNLAGYYYDFNDFQTTVSLDPLIATSRAIVNTDQEIWGVDVEALLAVSDNLTLNATYAYVDGNQDDVTNPATGEITSQDGLQGTPENSFAVGFDYNRELSDQIGFFMNGTYSYKDGALGIPAQGAASQIDLSSQNLLSGRLGVNVNIGNQDVTLALWGQNLLDDEYTIGGLPFNTFAFNTAVFGQPRTYGASAGVRF